MFVRQLTGLPLRQAASISGAVLPPVRGGSIRAAAREHPYFHQVKGGLSVQITEHVHMIRIPFQIGEASGPKVDRFVHAFLVYGREICLIDTGVASASGPIFEYLGKTGRDKREISRIVLTHTHPDHIGSARFIKEETGAQVFLHQAEKAWLEDPDLQFAQRPVPGFYNLVGGSVRVDELLEDGDTVDLGDGIELTVIHTPGHSSGSLSFFLGKERVLFCGDAVPVPGDTPIYDDVTASVSSIKSLQGIPAIRYLLSSWAPAQEGERAYQAMEEGLGYLQRIHDAVRKVARDNRPSAQEIAGPVMEELGLPARAANPLVPRSMEAHLRVMDRSDLLAERP